MARFPMGWKMGARGTGKVVDTALALIEQVQR
jgi:hypothetical protein